MPNPAGRAVEAESRSLVFQTLQPIFSRLLSDTEDAVKVTGVLTSALNVLERDLLLRGHLHLCLDYALFPFQFLLPSIAATRQSGARKGATCAVPAMASHVAAEKALQCFRTILQLAPPETSAQLSTAATLLGELTHVPAGSTYGAEACLHVLQSVRAALRPVAGKRGTIVSAEMQPTLGYLIHGLLGVVEAEQKGAGFGATPREGTLPLTARVPACPPTSYTTQSRGGSLSRGQQSCIALPPWLQVTPR